MQIGNHSLGFIIAVIVLIIVVVLLILALVNVFTPGALLLLALVGALSVARLT
jgi:hypothetical protein